MPVPQRDYRIFVGAFPTGELAGRIQAVREQFDPVTARITAPHVTLAGTYWRSGPPSPASEAGAMEQLAALRGQIHPFDLRLGGVAAFPPAEKPVIYLAVELDEGLLAARKALLAALGPDKHRSFTPHLTLAMRLDARRAGEMLAALRESEWAGGPHRAPIGELCLMQRGLQDPAWRTIYRLSLEG